MDLGPAPILKFLLRKLQLFSQPHTTIVATTIQPEDNALLAAAEAFGVQAYAGATDDVLTRFIDALPNAADEDQVVRLTGDNPFIDLELLDRCLRAHETTGADYTAPAGCPLGLGAEVIRMGALREAAKSTSDPWHREHVTPFIKEHPERFCLHTCQVIPDRSSYRLTIDTPDDLALARGIAKKLGSKVWAAKQETLVACLEADPKLRALNGHVIQRGRPA